MKTFTLPWIQLDVCNVVINDNLNVNIVIDEQLDSDLAIGFDHQKIIKKPLSLLGITGSVNVEVNRVSGGILPAVIEYSVEEHDLILYYEYVHDTWYKTVSYDSQEWKDEVKENKQEKSKQRRNWMMNFINWLIK